jgi:GTPase SAR1 family protein
LGWYELAKEVCGDKLTSVFVGNKADLEDQREVDPAMVKGFVSSEKIDYFETSCVNGTNIDNVFVCLVDGVLKKVQKGDILVEELVKKKNKFLAQDFNK